MERDEFKKRFPALAGEMDEGKGKADLSFTGDKPKRRFSGYDPDVIDFLRRCDTDEQAREIIEYLQGRDEVTAEQADELLTKLERDGVRSFGKKKKHGYYK